MGFSNTSTDISFEHFHLHATCTINDKDYKFSKLTLDDFIGNDNGKLFWGGQDFTDSCKDFSLKIVQNQKENTQYMILKCKAQKKNGVWIETFINLDEQIVNRDGDLTFISDLTKSLKK